METFATAETLLEVLMRIAKPRRPDTGTAPRDPAAELAEQAPTTTPRRWALERDRAWVSRFPFLP